MPKNNFFRKSLVIEIIFILLLTSLTALSTVGIKTSNANRDYMPHDPIYINGHNDFTSENGVTRGSGTSIDPFVIEDWAIEASSMDGITIRNASVFFEIRNCYIHNGGINNDGIVFINVTNGVIEDTIITNNRNGIMFRTQHIEKENSENNSIQNNTITSNRYDGINFEHTGWGHHKNNIISNNNLSYNNRGIYMIMSAENKILYNNIVSNDEIGIQLDMCGGGGCNNIIHHNNFIYNGEKQAFEEGDPLNHWDNGYPSGGNYWSDYTGIDNDGDGIGDTPYPIPGGINEDRYPLMEPVNGENQPPDAPIITGPTHGKIGVEHEYHFLLSDPDGDTMHLRIDWEFGTPSKWHGPFESGTNVSLNYTWRKGGTYTIRAQAGDSHGVLSEWGTLTVTMPRNRANFNRPFLNFLKQYSYKFLVLWHILGL